MMSQPEPPTIVVHGSRAIPLAVLVGAGCILGVLAWLSVRSLKHGGGISLEFGLFVVAGIAFWLLTQRVPTHRPVQLLILTQGIELTAQETGVIRWSEIVHVSLFTIPPYGADGLAIFITHEAASRLPPGGNHDLPALVDVSDGTKYLVLYGRDLEYPLSEVLAEIEARRLGQTGPLTKRAIV